MHPNTGSISRYNHSHQTDIGTNSRKNKPQQSTTGFGSSFHTSSDTHPKRKGGYAQNKEGGAGSGHKTKQTKGHHSSGAGSSTQESSQAGPYQHNLHKHH